MSEMANTKDPAHKLEMQLGIRHFLVVSGNDTVGRIMTK
jgi:hypothetical protein